MADKTTMRHAHGHPCPVTGQPIPRNERGHEIIFTDHDRPGCYNACAACHDHGRTIGEMLHDLNAKR